MPAIPVAIRLRRLDAAERIHRRTADFAGFALDLLAALDGFAVGVEETARQVVRKRAAFGVRRGKLPPNRW